MIRSLEERDYDAVIEIVNENWKSVYSGYVNPELLSDAGCRERAQSLREDFVQQRLEEYVWEENGEVLALLSVGDTADSDRMGDFEIWRIYAASNAQGRGIGGRLLAFAERRAGEKAYRTIVIWAFKQNIRAIEFYRKHGFRVDREEKLGEPYFADGIRLLKEI